MELLPLHQVNNPVLKTMGLYGDPHAVFVHPNAMIDRNVGCNDFAVLCSEGACMLNSKFVHVELYTDTSMPEGKICTPQWIIDLFRESDEPSTKAWLLPTRTMQLQDAGEIVVTCVKSSPQTTTMPVREIKHLVDNLFRGGNKVETIPLGENSVVACRYQTGLFLFSVLPSGAPPASSGGGPFLFRYAAGRTRIIYQLQAIEKERTIKQPVENNEAVALVTNVGSLHRCYRNVSNFINKHMAMRKSVESATQNGTVNAATEIVPPVVLIEGTVGTGKTCICKAIESGRMSPQFHSVPIVYTNAQHDVFQSKRSSNQSGGGQAVVTRECALQVAQDRLRKGEDLVVIIDDLDAVDTSSYDVQSTLSALIEVLKQRPSSYLLLTAKGRGALHKSFGSRGLVGYHFAIPDMDSEDRKAALWHLAALEKHAHDRGDLAFTAKECTKGFVLRDLVNVVSNAGLKATSLAHTAKRIKPLRLEAVQTVRPKATFENIGGYESIKMRMLQICRINLAKDRNGRSALADSLETESGILMHGPSGCGKTMLVEALANETNSHFVSVRAPDLLSPYLGQSEAKLRNLFATVRSAESSIVFIDEIDAIVPARTNFSSGNSSGGVGERLLATLLNEIDGIALGGRTVVVGATSRLEAVDPALRRPGRLGACIHVPYPDDKNKRAISKLYAVKYQLDELDDQEVYGAGSCADVARLYKDKAMESVRRRIEALPAASTTTVPIRAPPKDDDE